MRHIILIFFYISLIYCAEKSDVYFTKKISPETLVEMFEKLNVNLPGNIALKVHSGEPDGPYFLRPNFLQKIYDHTKGTFVECNVAYTSKRLNTSTHIETLRTNGWYDNQRRFDIMDEDPAKDISFKLENYNKINITYAGKNLEKYDSCVVLSHFKGHQMGGFGGALKQLSIGFASTQGKTWIHTAGASTDYRDFGPKRANQMDFTDSMADAASAIVKYFKSKGNIVYINVLANISLACDCAGTRAPQPKIKDIGILASTDPVAIDMACLDLIKKTSEEGTQPFIDQVANLLGENTILKAEALNIGTTKYNLINIDGDDSDDTDSDSHSDTDSDSDTDTDSDTDSDSDSDDPGSPGSFISLSYCVTLLILLLFI